MKKVPPIKELKKICFKGEPDTLRLVSIYFTRFALMFGCRANFITFLRVVFLALGFATFFHGLHWALLGVIFLQITLFLDTMDGAIARYNKESNFLGEAMDLTLDHISSTVVYFLALGVLTQQYLLPVLTIILAQFAAFFRALYVEYHIPVEKLKQKSFFLRLFHQDNMRLLLLILTFAVILGFAHPLALSNGITVFFVFIIIKGLYLKFTLITLTKKVPSPKILIAYIAGLAFILLYIITRIFGKKPTRFAAFCKRKFGNTVIMRTLLNLAR